ncbi:MAG TPA: peptidoglycan-binding domain-containing protein, partial [Nocardioides sp.]|nr:peptidoglycan-binding domain-containing protein [Nocardioides sp.]
MGGPRVRAAVGLACAWLVLVACGDDGDSTSNDEVERAQARVEAAKRDLVDARDAAEVAATEFCDQARDYITALDRYGDVLASTKPTVGDVRDAGADLAAPSKDVAAAAESAAAAREDVLTAEQDLAQTQTALAEARDTTPKPTPTSTATVLVPQVPPASTDRVQQAQADLDATVDAISDQTPLEQAGQQLNAAAVALEMSWLRLFSEVGCLSDEQQAQAATAVRDYTATLQESLALAGHYTEEVDGVYGPATVEAVRSLQDSHGLPATGTVDTATAAALHSDLAAQGGAAEQQSSATTAAVQQTLTLTGFWTAPVDGEWTPALTEALKAFQTDLGVNPTGTVDAATITALERAIADADADEPEATPTTPPSEDDGTDDETDPDDPDDPETSSSSD